VEERGTAEGYIDYYFSFLGLGFCVRVMNFLLSSFLVRLVPIFPAMLNLAVAVRLES
jgi:hypothetical protein